MKLTKEKVLEILQQDTIKREQFPGLHSYRHDVARDLISDKTDGLSQTDNVYNIYFQITTSILEGMLLYDKNKFQSLVEDTAKQTVFKEKLYCFIEDLKLNNSNNLKSYTTYCKTLLDRFDSYKDKFTKETEKLIETYNVYHDTGDINEYIEDIFVPHIIKPNFENSLSAEIIAIQTLKNLYFQNKDAFINTLKDPIKLESFQTKISQFIKEQTPIYEEITQNNPREPHKLNPMMNKSEYYLRHTLLKNFENFIANTSESDLSNQIENSKIQANSQWLQFFTYIKTVISKVFTKSNNNAASDEKYFDSESTKLILLNAANLDADDANSSTKSNSLKKQIINDKQAINASSYNDSKSSIKSFLNSESKQDFQIDRYIDAINESYYPSESSIESSIQLLLYDGSVKLVDTP